MLHLDAIIAQIKKKIQKKYINKFLSSKISKDIDSLEDKINVSYSIISASDKDINDGIGDHYYIDYSLTILDI